MHAFTPAIDPPWETRSDYDIFGALGRKVSELATGHLDTRTDVMTIPCCTTPRTRWPCPAAWCATGRPARWT